MRNLKTITKLTALITLLGLGAFGVEASKRDRMVTVTVHRVAQKDNLDHDIPFIPDRADFYAEIWIDGKYHKTHNMSKDDGRPYWRFSVPASERYVPIRIKLIDDDGGLEKRDDYVDINPMNQKKDLELIFDTRTGMISGDAYGHAGRFVYSEGGGDSSQGRIWFTVQ